MRLLLAAAITAALASSAAAAVNIELFVTNTTCQTDYGGHYVCSDIQPLTCCHYLYQEYHSAKCLGLGLTDHCSFAGVPRPNTNPPIGSCGYICNTGSGTPAPCVDTGVCWVGTGAYWVKVPPQLSLDEVPTECEQTVEPDLVVFGNGQSFRINYDVPAGVTAQLTELLKSDPGLVNGVPGEVAAFEVKVDKAA